MQSSISILFKAYAEADGLGRLIFLMLFTLSILSWTVLVQKFLLIRKAKALSQKWSIKVLKQKENLLSAKVKESFPFSDVYSVFRQKTTEILEKNRFFAKDGALFLSRGDVKLIENSVLSSISGQAKKLEKNLFVLSTVVTLAPFLGLLGTVWGILITFGELQRGGSMASNNVILGGLATALATTVLGLIIAIPALVGYNVLKSSIRHFFSDMEHFGDELISTIELQYRKVET